MIHFFDARALLAEFPRRAQVLSSAKRQSSGIARDYAAICAESRLLKVKGSSRRKEKEREGEENKGVAQF